MLSRDPARRPTPSALLEQGVFGSSKSHPQDEDMEVPESAVVPKPEADDAQGDPLEGKHIFDPAEATQESAPTQSGELKITTALELQPPKAYGILGRAGLQVQSIVAASQMGGSAQWTLERCLLQCDSGVSELEESTRWRSARWLCEGTTSMLSLRHPSPTARRSVLCTPSAP
ncbi:unnamed protein product [Prorocentrum cordatum]|uniref:Uncharacterized protein n=1 Tax=Prorocentrum cordatum TaxID=2364126 RepID=A0ABN9TYG7_9DINO|nr:unnamed protein product [Polarella glacialis]